jgi:RNA polymerase sigma factor (sigma-70 family)
MAHSSRTLDFIPPARRYNLGNLRRFTGPARMEISEDPASREATFLAQLDLIERVTAYVCARNHLMSADADDFASHVKLKLLESDYAILGKFQGRCSLKTYLTVVINHLFLDYRISAWGKWRPSAEARRAGPIGMLLEQLLVRDGYSLDEAYEVMTTNHRLTRGRAEIERLAATFPARVRRRFQSPETLADLPSTNRPADASLADRDCQRLAGRVSDVLHEVMQRFDAQDRLIIAMRYEDGRTVANIATGLGLDQKALYRRLDRLHRDLKEGLEAEGLNSDVVMEILESPAVTIDWRRDDMERTAAGPSMTKGTRE